MRGRCYFGKRLAVFRFGPDTLDDGTKGGLRLATLRRVKGLEFDRAVIASDNDGLLPHRSSYKGAGDAAERDKAATNERALLLRRSSARRRRCWS